MSISRGGMMRATVNLGRLGLASLGFLLLGGGYFGLWPSGPWTALALILLLFPLIPTVTATPAARGSSWRWWLIYAVGFNLFAAIRAIADSAGAPVRYRDGLVVGQFLFHGQTASGWLQQTLMQPDAHDPLTIAMTLVYGSFFFVPTAVGLWLGRRRPTELAGYVQRSIVIWLVGIVCFLALPTAPPWMAARDGYVVGIQRADVLLLHPGIYQQLLHYIGVNDVAALPSIHVALTWLAMLALWRHGRRWRLAGGLYGSIMMFAVVYLGEHWTLDVVAGLALALLAHWLVDRRRWSTDTGPRIWRQPSASGPWRRVPGPLH